MWAQLENFTRLVHKGLDRQMTSYTIANEGRRLIECDRVSVAINKGRKCTIEAVSGQDTFDKRSNTVTILGRLATAVVATGETVWYTGDTSMMAPQVEEAMQDYVDECHSKAVAIVPLKEPHDATDPTANPKVLGALVIEQIEDSRPRDGLMQRIEVVSDHSAIALNNVREHNELFLMPVWRAIGKSKWVLEARQLPWTIAVAVTLVFVTVVLCLWPADFDLSAKGRLIPSVKRHVFAPIEGTVIDVPVRHEKQVKQGEVLARLENLDLNGKVHAMVGNVQTATQELSNKNRQLNDPTQKLDRGETSRLQGEIAKLKEEQKSYRQQLELLRKKQDQLTIRSPIDGTVVTWDVYKTLIFRPVQLGTLLMDVEEPGGQWELEVQMPESRMGYINDALKASGDAPLTVEYITATKPGVTHVGTVKEIHRTAEVRGEEGNTVILRVAINKDDIADDLRDGAEVTTKVHCGRASIGYVWLHDLISFFQSKVLFRIF